VGAVWYWLLLAWSPSPVYFFAGAILAAIAAVSVCGQAELALEQHDPPSVVLDEIVAMPWCFFVPLAVCHGFHPPIPLTMAKETFAGFLLFRFFDIVKPPPIRQLQRLPGGLGVVADDLAAALVSGLALWGLCAAGFIA
jgi:phosphatidylglycerophosphatase A